MEEIEENAETEENETDTLLNLIEEVKQKLTDNEYKLIIEELGKIKGGSYNLRKMNIFVPRYYEEDDGSFINTMKVYTLKAKCNKEAEESLLPSSFGLIYKEDLSELFYEKDIVELLMDIFSDVECCIILIES